MSTTIVKRHYRNGKLVRRHARKAKTSKMSVKKHFREGEQLQDHMMKKSKDC